MKLIISGIQQIGIGVNNAEEAFTWYRKIFGTDIVVFKDAAPASLMNQYTGNSIHERIAILAMNLQGGGGFELWQYTSRDSVMPVNQIQLGDYGIFSVKIKCRDIAATFRYFQRQGVNIISTPSQNALGIEFFFYKIPMAIILKLLRAMIGLLQIHIPAVVCVVQLLGFPILLNQ